MNSIKSERFDSVYWKLWFKISIFLYLSFFVWQNRKLQIKSKIKSFSMILIIAVIISHFHVLALNVNLFRNHTHTPTQILVLYLWAVFFFFSTLGLGPLELRKLATKLEFWEISHFNKPFRLEVCLWYWNNYNSTINECQFCQLEK